MGLYIFLFRFVADETRMQVRVQGGCPPWQLLNLRSLGPKIWLRMAQRLATFGQSFVCFLSCPASPFPLSQFPLFICSSFMAQKISPNQNIECSKHFCWYLDQKIKKCFDRSKLEPKIWLLTVRSHDKHSRLATFGQSFGVFSVLCGFTLPIERVFALHL